MINVVVLAGNVVSDPESRSTSTGKTVATFRLAINNPINDKDTVFIDVDVWEKQAEFVINYVKKGGAVSVTGRLKQDSWEKDGEKRSKILVVAERVGFVGSKKKDEDSSEQDGPAPAQPQRAQKTVQSAPPPKPAAKQSWQKPKPVPRQQDESNDEEIPI